MPAVGEILVVLPRGGPGGAAMAALDLAERVRERGLAVRVVVAGGLPVGWDGPVARVPELDRGLRQVVPVALALRRTFRDRSPALVHGHGVGLGLAISLATARGRSVPALTTLHGLPPEDVARAARVLRLAGLPVVSVGAGLAAELVEQGVQATSIANAVGPAPAAMDRAVLAETFTVPDDASVVVAVGRLVEQKDPLALVRALERLDDVVAIFVGEGPLAVEVESLARRLGVADRVRISGWRSDARQIMGAADAVVALSRWEGFARVGLEAMAAGVPLVASQGAAFAGLARNGVDAVLVDPADAEAVAAAVTRVLGDTALAGALRAAGLARVARFDPEGMVDAYLGQYTRLLAR